MAIVYRTYAEAVATGDAAEIKQSWRATAGDVWFLFHQINDDSRSIFEPPGWTKVAVAVESGSPALQVRMFYRVVSRNEPSVYKLTPDGGLGSSTQSIFSALLYRGVHNRKPVARFVTKHVTKNDKYICPDVGKMHPSQLALYGVGGVTNQWSFVSTYPYDITVPTRFWGGTWSQRTQRSLYASNTGGSLLTFDGSGDGAAKGPELIHTPKRPGENYREAFLAMLGAVVNPDDLDVDEPPKVVDKAFAGWGIPPNLKAGKP